MIHEFTIKNGSANITIHVVAKTREDAITILKSTIFSRQLTINVGELCSVSVDIQDINENQIPLSIPLQKSPSERIKESGRYFFAEEPPEDEITKPDNPAAIRRSSQKIKAIK